MGDLFVGSGSYPSVKIENRLNQGCGGVRFRRDTELYEEIFQPIRGQYCDAITYMVPALQYYDQSEDSITPCSQVM